MQVGSKWPLFKQTFSTYNHTKYLNLSHNALQTLYMCLVLLQPLNKHNGHQILLPIPIIVINRLIKLIFIVDFVQMITEIERVLNFLDSIDFVDDFGF